MLQRGGQVKDVGVADGEARPQGSDQLAFGSPPQVGDALYLGFEEPLDRLLLQIEVDASQARGAGVNPEDPPLSWEVSQADGQWAAHGCARTAHRLRVEPEVHVAPEPGTDWNDFHVKQRKAA